MPHNHASDLARTVIRAGLAPHRHERVVQRQIDNVGVTAPVRQPNRQPRGMSVIEHRQRTTIRLPDRGEQDLVTAQVPSIGIHYLLS